MQKVCFGVDVGGTAIKVGLFQQDGKLLSQWEFPTKRTGKGEDILEDVATFLLERMKEKKIDQDSVIGIGIGLPGPVRENGEVSELANLGIGHFNIEDGLRQRTGLKVKAGNDANVAALGEFWQGGGKGYQNMVLVTLGTGVGGGIILQGSILTGSNGAAGEIGHLTVDKMEKNQCGCGKRGCLEQYASATGVVRMAMERLEGSSEQTLLTTAKKLNAKFIFDRAKAGDEVACEIVNKACEYLGLALSYVAQVIDPEVFVLGGGVSKAGSILTEKTQYYYEQQVMPSLKQKEFRLATLGNDAGIYGSACLILASNGLLLNKI